VPLTLRVSDSVPDVLRLKVTERVSEPLTDLVASLDPGAVKAGLGEVVTLRVAVLAFDAVTEAAPLDERDKETLLVRDTVPLPVRVPTGDEGRPLVERERVTLVVCERQTEMVAVTVGLRDCVEARVVAAAETDCEGERVRVTLTVELPQALDVRDGGRDVATGDAVTDSDGVALAEATTLPLRVRGADEGAIVSEGESEGDREAEPHKLLDALRVDGGDFVGAEAVAGTVPVAQPLGETEGVRDKELVAQPLALVVGSCDGGTVKTAVRERVPVTQAEGETVAEGTTEGEALRVKAPVVAMGEPVLLCEALRDGSAGVGEGETLPEAHCKELAETVSDSLCVAHCVSEAEEESVPLADALSSDVADAEPQKLALGVAVAAATEGVAEGHEEGVGVPAATEGVTEAHDDALADGELDRVLEAEGVSDAEPHTLALGVGVAKATEGVAEAQADAQSVPEGVAPLEVAMGEGEGDAVAPPASEALAVMLPQKEGEVVAQPEGEETGDVECDAEAEFERESTDDIECDAEAEFDRLVVVDEVGVEDAADELLAADDAVGDGE
jgi:hypothetical protein